MNISIVMLGSNSNEINMLELAIVKLADSFEIVGQSSVLITKPFGAQYSSEFHNKALKLSVKKTLAETKTILKEIEKEMGRTNESKAKGIIPIDIDLIFWNETLMHNDYQRFEFVKQCVDEVR